MRAWLEAAEDKTLPSGSPSLKSQTPKTKWRRLARLFLRFYRGKGAGGRTASGIVITKVPVKSGFWRGVWKIKRFHHRGHRGSQRSPYPAATSLLPLRVINS